MRRRLVWTGALASAASVIAFACASIIGAGDLTCSAGDAAAYTLDPCIGESGVAILPLSGELHDLVYVDATLVAVGYAQGTSTQFAVQLFSMRGEALGDPQLDSADSAANAAATDFYGVWVVGGDGESFMLRHYTPNPFSLDQAPKNFPTTSSGVALREAVAIADNTLFGTTADGRLVVVRTQNSAPWNSTGHDAIYDASIPLRATDGILVQDDAGTTVTILGDTPNAALGLAMVRWVLPDPNTNIDRSFNDGGSLLASFGTGGSARTLVNVPGDRTYWVGGQAADASGFVIAHINWDGTFDNGYGQGGVVVATGTNRGANAMVFTPQGLVVAGFDNGKMAFARFTFDAGLDPTFGDGGVLTLGIPGELRAMTQTPDHIVAGGFANVDGGTQWALVWLVVR